MQVSSYTVSVGDAITFKYSTAHNVYLVTSEDKWNYCDLNGGKQLAGFSKGGGEAGPSTPNLYTVTATATGILYVVCQPHCSSGQKVKIHVTAGAAPPPPPLSPSGTTIAPLPRVPKTFVNVHTCSLLLNGDFVGHEACGSPGEVANEPAKRNLYNTYLTDVGSSAPQGYPADIPTVVATVADNHRDKVDSFNEHRTRGIHVNLRQGKNIAWTMVALNAADQLRQRVAWSLYQASETSTSLPPSSLPFLSLNFPPIFTPPPDLRHQRHQHEVERGRVVARVL